MRLRPRVASGFSSIRTGVLWSVALAGLGVAFAASQYYYWPQIGDDSFIFFRYAENLAAGHGLSWNIGGSPVEGFSSPLWVLLLAAARALGFDTVATAKALGIGMGLGAMLAGGLVAFSIGRNKVAAAVGAAALLLLKPLQYWAPSGMETGLYAFLLVLAVLTLTRGPSWLGGLALGLVGIARPEGPAVVVVALAILWRLEPGRGRRPFSTTAAISLGIVAAYSAFRGVYFGDFLPNTYYAKTGGTLALRLMNGWAYVAPVWPFWGSVVIVFMLLAASGRLARDGRLAAALSILIATLIAGIALLGGGDWMWNYRLLVPVLVLLVAAAAGMAGALLERAPGSLVISAVVAFVVFGVPGCLRLASAGIVGPGEVLAGARGARLPHVEIQEGTMTQTSLDVGRFLREVAPPGALIAVNHAGAVPYYSGLRTLDMTGLNDRHIAHEVGGGLHEKFDEDYVLRCRPDYIVLNSRVRPGTNGYWYVPGYWAGESALVAHPEFQANYRFLRRYWTWRWHIPENHILVAYRLRSP